MKNYVVGVLLIGLSLVAVVPAAIAHHSFAAEFDAAKAVTIRGNVTKVDWGNPHVWVYLNVKEQSGKVVNWGFEMGAPQQVRNQGWDRTTLKTGDEIVVEGFLARNGSARMNARSVTWAATGKKLGAASSSGAQ
jgi:hypothetical protein